MDKWIYGCKDKCMNGEGWKNIQWKYERKKKTRLIPPVIDMDGS